MNKKYVDNMELARAYLAMGDVVGARELLQELVDGGDREAQALLETLPPVDLEAIERAKRENAPADEQENIEIPDIAQFVSQYTPASRGKIRFAWNCKHSSEFRDANQKFRWLVVDFCIAHPELAPPILLEHLFLADAEWAAEAWGAPIHFAQLAEVLLMRGQEAVLDTFSKGFTRSFDTFGACHYIQLPKALLASLAESAQASLAQATEAEQRKRLESALELFEKLGKGSATEKWAIIAPGASASNTGK